MKDFLNVCKPKKMSKEELADIILEYQRDLIKSFVKGAHKQENFNHVNRLYDMMSTEKFVKALKYIFKEKLELDVGFAVIINGLFERRLNRDEHPEFKENFYDSYMKILSKLLKGRIKEIQEKIDIDKMLLTEILAIAPAEWIISNPRVTGIYFRKIMKKVYYFAGQENSVLHELTAKQIKKLFSMIFGKNLIDVVAVEALLEPKETMRNFNEHQLALWNTMTQFALTVIEKQEDKEQIKKLIKYYVQRRTNDAKNNRDSARRIQLSTVSEEDYPKIAKIVAKLASKEEYASYM